MKDSYKRIHGDSGQHRRILWMALVLGVLGFIPMIARLYDLMVTHYDYYAEKALRNQTRTTTVTADRGILYDRNMNILACSVGVENIYLDPNELKQSQTDIPKLSQDLAQLLSLDAAWVQTQATDTTMRYKQIAAKVDAQTAAQVRQYINQTNTKGIHLEPDTKRYYPYGTLASQVIGFTNASNEGSEGIEAAYNSYLTGTAGKVITTKGNNQMDMPYSYEAYEDATPGCSLVLTIDVTVQAALEKQMRLAIDRYDVQNGAFGMVMNVKTGEILAMATLGSYDPNAYLEIYDPQLAAQAEDLRQQYLSLEPDTDAYKQAKQTYDSFRSNAQLKQWRNRCISDGYEPGSTFKVMTMAAALDCGAITLDTSFHCAGAEQIPGRSQRLHCWRSAGHGAQTTANALQNSCNLAFAHIALKLGGERFYDYVERFGILEKTGLDLAGESKGVFFSKELVTDTDKWGTASLTSGSFGQTFKLTPIQLVRGIAAVVNGGYLIEPYIVAEAVDAQGNTVLRQETTVLRQVISQETSKIMCTLLESVVNEGTAKNAKVAGYAIGGKTGTSEKIDVLDASGQPTLDKIVSFVGVAPMDDPEYIILVALDTPSRSTGIYISGGVMAAPTVGAVMGDILPYLGVKRNEPLDTVTIPDLTGMTKPQMEKALKELGLTAQIQGAEETVTSQIPAAGQTVPGNSQMWVYFGQTETQPQVEVPDFTGMTRQQAVDAAGLLGLYVLVTGNDTVAPHVVVTAQQEKPGTLLDAGSTVTLQFTDMKAAD